MNSHDCCGTETCHRTNVNPYCSATVRVRCDYCGKVRTVNGLHFCDCDKCKGIDPDGDNCHWLSCEAKSQYVTPSGQYCWAHTPSHEWGNREDY